MPETEERWCDDPDCDQPADRGSKCWAHIKRDWRRRQGMKVPTGPIRPYGMSASQLLAHTATRYADAETDEEFAALRRTLMVYARRAIERGRNNVHASPKT